MTHEPSSVCERVFGGGDIATARPSRFNGQDSTAPRAIAVTQDVDYLLNHHPTEFTWLGQSCEDRTGRWLYPSAPYNAGYNSKVKTVCTEAFPNQYVAFDKVLGAILKHVDDKTYVIVISDQGIKPRREFEETDPHTHMGHEKTTPVVAKHDFADGDDVPGSFFAMGPGIKTRSASHGI